MSASTGVLTVPTCPRLYFPSRRAEAAAAGRAVREGRRRAGPRHVAERARRGGGGGGAGEVLPLPVPPYRRVKIQGRAEG
jgi:hypothetical protein